MELTSYTDYGLRALMLLAVQPDCVQSAATLAGRLDVSRHHLAKVLFDLAAGGYLLSQRGATGGVRLARPPDQIRLGEVVRYLERKQAIAECFRPRDCRCNLLPSCRLRGAFGQAKEAFITSLNDSTLAEMTL